MAVKNTLPSKLLRRCRAFAGQLTKLAKAGAPNHLRPFIHSKVEPETESPTYTIRIFVDKDKNKAQKYGSQDAAAQEFGSGLYGKNKAKYPIPPKNKGAIWFPYEEGKIYEGAVKYVNNGVMGVTTQKVMSDGIRARPYIKPAVTELRRHIREDLDVDIREALNVSMREAFAGAKRK